MLFQQTFIALFSPSPSPNPNTAMSESFKTDLISAKSRFINPCPKTRSTTAFIPILKILLASLKAFCKVIDLSGKSNSLSLGIITKLSTFVLKVLFHFLHYFFFFHLQS